MLHQCVVHVSIWDWSSDRSRTISLQAFTKEDNIRGCWVSIIYDIVSSIFYQLSLYSNFKVKFVRRQANMIAHTLVRAACS